MLYFRQMELQAFLRIADKTQNNRDRKNTEVLHRADKIYA
jgi:hypothetical protein